MARKTSSDIVLRTEQDTALTYLDLDGNFMAVKQSLEDIALLTGGTAPENSLSEYALKTELFSGSYDDLTDKPSLDDLSDAVATLNSRVANLEAGTPNIPFITVSASTFNVDETENRQVVFTVTSRNFESTDNITYSISGTNITASDIVATPLAGTLFQGNQQTQFVVNIKTDTLTESATEILSFNVTSDSTHELFNSPPAVNVTILDTSFNSIMKTVAYTCSGDFYTWAKTNTASFWSTNFDSSGLLASAALQAQMVQDAKDSVSRAGLVGLGLTNAQIDQLVVEFVAGFVAEYNSDVTERFPLSVDTAVYQDFVYDLFGDHGGIRSYGNDELDSNIGKQILIDTNLGVTFARSDLACENVTYSQSYTVGEITQVVDVLIASGGVANWELFTTEQQEILRTFIIEVIVSATNGLSTLDITMDLYHYEILNQIP